VRVYKWEMIGYWSFHTLNCNEPWRLYVDSTNLCNNAFIHRHWMLRTLYIPIL
jgi:hypothetical protein